MAALAETARTVVDFRFLRSLKPLNRPAIEPDDSQVQAIQQDEPPVSQIIDQVEMRLIESPPIRQNAADLTAAYLLRGSATAVNLQIENLHNTDALFTNGSLLGRYLTAQYLHLSAMQSTVPANHPSQSDFRRAQAAVQAAENALQRVKNLETAPPTELTARERRILERKIELHKARGEVMHRCHSKKAAAFLSDKGKNHINRCVRRLNAWEALDQDDQQTLTQLALTVEDFLSHPPHEQVQLINNSAKSDRLGDPKFTDTDDSHPNLDTIDRVQTFFDQRQVILQFLQAVKQEFGSTHIRGGNLKTLISDLGKRAQADSKNAQSREVLTRLQTLTLKALRHPFIQGYIRLTQAVSEPSKQRALVNKMSDRLTQKINKYNDKLTEVGRTLTSTQTAAADAVWEAGNSSFAALNAFNTWLDHAQRQENSFKKRIRAWIAKRLENAPQWYRSTVDQLPTRLLEHYYSLWEGLTSETFSRTLQNIIGTASAIGLVLLIREVSIIEKARHVDLPPRPIVYPPKLLPETYPLLPFGFQTESGLIFPSDEAGK